MTARLLVSKERTFKSSYIIGSIDYVALVVHHVSGYVVYTICRVDRGHFYTDFYLVQLFYYKVV